MKVVSIVHSSDFVLYFLTMGLSFDEAAEKVKTLSQAPSNDQKLKLYGHFKQATVGDNNTCKFCEWMVHV